MIASGTAISHHRRWPSLRYTSREAMNEGKSVGSAISCARRPAAARNSMRGMTSLTTWWPIGVSSGWRIAEAVVGIELMAVLYPDLAAVGQQQVRGQHSLAPVISRTASAA